MHGELKSLLATIRRRWLALAMLTTTGRAAAASAVPLFAAALAGWVLQPTGAMVVTLAIVAVVGALAAASMIMRRTQRRPNDHRVARFVEERTAAPDWVGDRCEPDSIVSAVQVMEPSESSPAAFAALIVGQAVRTLRALEPTALIPRAAMRRGAATAGASVGVLILAVVAAFPYLVRGAATVWVSVFPASIQISVMTGDVRVAAGQPLRIAARVQGRGATVLGVVPSLRVSAEGQERSVAMTTTGDRFEYAFDSVDRSFQYRVTAGGARSSDYTVTALFPARIKRIDVRYDYPSFTGLAPRTEENGGDIYGPEGTRVHLVVHTDKPIAAGALSLTSGRPVRLAAARDDASTADLVLAEDDGYRVTVTDVDGLQSSGDTEYFIRIMDDRPPDVRLVRPSADQGITPLEEVSIEARADDDHGVAALDLVYGVAGREPRTVPFRRVTGTNVAKIGAHLLAAEDLRVQPGDVITYYARARDVPRGKRSTETRSDIFFLEVKPFNEEFVSAQSQAMGGGAAGNDIDGLVAAQKEIINATWNLERRSGAGRSAEDAKTVGQAQAELKARAQQLLKGARRSGPGLYAPQRVGAVAPPQRQAAGDPVAAAIEAMGRAVEELQAERTAGALPHELAALQGLLQAQAEVRRRQVMQSASGAGQGGSNRSDRDLSALFDRELQRQQRTNYETPKSSNAAPEPRETSDTLDRVRELAKRQEEIARRQRELANGQLPAEEMKRQLERLTREQEELQRQAEALEKQMKDAGAQNAQGAGGAQGGPSAGASANRRAQDMRRVGEQMRNAAGEMQRQNAGGAAATGEKAADALRQLERQMRGGGADERQRAAGELQLEAQQIAERQRQIASEMSRLEKDGNASAGRNGNAARRLAGEKEALADRVDALQRAATQMDREGAGGGDTRFRDAAQQLEGQKIGSRMRESAKQLRGQRQSSGQTAGQSTAGAQSPMPDEQQIARALDDVAKRLGASGQTDAGRLTEELDRTRAMRENLNQLEQRVREAEAKANGARGGQRGGSSAGREGEATSGRQAQQAGGRGQSGDGVGGGAEQQAQRAREEYARELQRTREAVGRMQREQAGGDRGSTPEHHEYSLSSPGNESYKQDFSGWASLRKDVDLAMEKHDAAVSSRLARKLAEDRLSAGGSERVPENYRQMVSKYFEAIAKVKK